MLSPRLVRTAASVAGGPLVPSCPARVPAPSQVPAPVVAAAPLPPAPVPKPAPDPALELIDLSTRHFEAGQRELELGHLDAAKTEFNRALEVLLESPFGGRTEPRIRD